jgi:nucleoside-diphosphate-sugar epimerase
MWSPVHTQDVLDCVFRLLEEQEFNNKTYFLAAGRKVTLEEITHIMCDILGVARSSMEELSYFEKGHLALRRAVDSCREILGRPSFPDHAYSNEGLKRDFGFSPKVDLREGIKETIEWARRENKLV